ncbi:MAG: hypothetical protein IJE43_17250 [Alphaproteobacteria bacterium]|nr:hypothetical protein [Alphaproteobacteria bacterium]MBQ6888568.1 hypothetical protein [Lachnospiraceae bacterium]
MLEISRKDTMLDNYVYTRKLCIYVTYDREGIVDDYIGYMLNELKTCVDTLIVISNKEEIASGLENISKFADRYFFRKNIGYDSGAFKDALCDLIGWDEVYKYDELVLVNDSFFGPFVPMKEIFSELDKKKWDFCGLAKFAEVLNADKRHFQEHIHSFFLRIKKCMFHSKEFREYWEKLPYFEKFEDVVHKHEVLFTQYFAKLGYRYDVLADTECNDSHIIKNNFLQYYFVPYELISKRNFPFLKKKSLYNNTLKEQTQENLRQAIDYVDKNTNYDVNLIWKNIIRTMDMQELQHSLHLRYIILESEVETVTNTAIIIVKAEWKNAVEYVWSYLGDIKDYIRVLIFSEADEIRRIYRDKGFETVPSLNFNRIREYQYICYFEDEDMSSDRCPNYIAKSHIFGIWSNLLKNHNYINNIIMIFGEEQFLGALFPPRAIFGNYFGEEQRGISGWYRGDIFEQALELKELHKIKKMMKDKMYYSAIVEHGDYASVNETNLEYYINHIIRQVKKQYGDFTSFLEMSKLISQSAIESLCKRKKYIYVYGIGYMAKQYSNIIQNVKGYIVSDGHTNPRRFNGKDVLFLSEITCIKDIGVVVCVDEKNQATILELLSKKGIKDCVCI